MGRNTGSLVAQRLQLPHWEILGVGAAPGAPHALVPRFPPARDTPVGAQGLLCGLWSLLGDPKEGTTVGEVWDKSRKSL